MVEGIAPVLDLVAAIEPNVFSNAESCQCAIEADSFQTTAPLLTKWLRFHHD
jgi:hypothetical protein